MLNYFPLQYIIIAHNFLNFNLNEYINEMFFDRSSKQNK